MSRLSRISRPAVQAGHARAHGSVVHPRCHEAVLSRHRLGSDGGAHRPWRGNRRDGAPRTWQRPVLGACVAHSRRRESARDVSCVRCRGIAQRHELPRVRRQLPHRSRSRPTRIAGLPTIAAHQRVCIGRRTAQRSSSAARSCTVSGRAGAVASPTRKRGRPHCARDHVGSRSRDGEAPLPLSAHDRGCAARRHHGARCVGAALTARLSWARLSWARMEVARAAPASIRFRTCARGTSIGRSGRGGPA